MTALFQSKINFISRDINSLLDNLVLIQTELERVKKIAEKGRAKKVIYSERIPKIESMIKTIESFKDWLEKSA